jgi:hypothetical protein
MRPLMIFIGLLAFSGCAQYRAERQAEQNQADGAKCESFGAIRGTAPYIQCMVDMDNQRAANRRAAIAGVQQSLQSFQPVLPSYQVQPIPNPLANQAPRNMTCNTMGQMTNCSTY